MTDPGPVISRRRVLPGLGGVGLLLGCSSGAAKRGSPTAGSAKASSSGVHVETVPTGTSAALAGPHVRTAAQITKADVARFGPLANGLWGPMTSAPSR